MGVEMAAEGRPPCSPKHTALSDQGGGQRAAATVDEWKCQTSSGLESESNLTGQEKN